MKIFNKPFIKIIFEYKINKMQPKTFGKRAKGKEKLKLSNSPNFDGTVFKNPIPTSMSINFLKVLKDYVVSNSNLRKPSKPVPIKLVAKNSFNVNPSQELSVRWLGHASSVIEINGKRILTDPVLSERVSPFSFSGPKRLHPNPMSLENLPHIDAIIISHNHYDHLDYEFVSAITEKDIKFIMPLGVGSYLKHWGVNTANIIELDWHSSYSLDDVLITSTPARHFSGRGLLDRNKSQWASFVIESKKQKLFFCGDSGYFDGFKEIGDKYGGFDITMIGIGAYNEQWQAIHTNPAEAVKAHKFLKGKYLLPIHWCTFDLALHSWDEPINWLLKEASKHQVQLILPQPGEAINTTDFENSNWWL